MEYVGCNNMNYSVDAALGYPLGKYISVTTYNTRE